MKIVLILFAAVFIVWIVWFAWRCMTRCPQCGGKLKPKRYEGPVTGPITAWMTMDDTVVCEKCGHEVFMGGVAG